MDVARFRRKIRAQILDDLSVPRSLMDDDEQFRTLTQAVLESKSYEVVPAEDGFAGLATLKQLLPEIIISDCACRT